MIITAMLVYGDTPPSLNVAGTRGSHWIVNRYKKRWQHVILEPLLLSSGLRRGLQHVDATASMRFPVRRRRDADNHSWLLVKALGDALVNGGFIADDTPDHFQFHGLTFESELGPARTTIWLEATT